MIKQHTLVLLVFFVSILGACQTISPEQRSSSKPVRTIHSQPDPVDTENKNTTSAPLSVNSTSPKLPDKKTQDLSNNAIIFEGFGNKVTGGDKRRQYVVTSLLNDGKGTLREALSTGERNIFFSVAGTIHLKSEIVVRNSDISVNGFSAPSPGISLFGNGINIMGNPADATGGHAANILIQGIRIINASDDGIRIWRNAHDIVIDHVSVLNSADGNIDITEGAHDITVSNSLLINSGSGAALQSYQAYHVSWHHNLFFGANGRNPRVVHGPRQYSEGPKPQHPLADVRDNVIWNYGWGMLFQTYPDGRSSGNAVSNLFAHDPGLNAPSSHLIVDNADVYVTGNTATMDVRTTRQYQSNMSITSTNSNTTYTQWPVPKIIEPATTDIPGRIMMWSKVVKEAGLSKVFPDTHEEAAARTWGKVPTKADFKKPWNDG